MNKNKLRSLMFHAGFCNEDGGWDNRPIHEQEHDNLQRFAELIVRECIEQVEVFNVRMDARPRHIVEAIKSHFGVGE